MTSHPTSHPTSHSTRHSIGRSLGVDHAHRRAARHAAAELGLRSDPVVIWDHEHPLQGHVDVDGRHLVLIAPRRTDLAPRLLDETAWDELRHGVARAA